MRLVLTGILIAVTFLGGCLFEPRVAALPGGADINYLEQSEPEFVLANLQSAFQHTDASGYERQIAEDFVYEPDSSTEANYPGLDWETWNREMEIQFITNFFNNVAGISADLTAEELHTDWSGSFAELRYVYAIEVESGGSTVPYRATATLEFILDGTFWKLSRWYDENGENDPESGGLLPTIGQRRGAFLAAGGS
jgi:hypothetical protein